MIGGAVGFGESVESKINAFVKFHFSSPKNSHFSITVYCQVIMAVGASMVKYAAASHIDQLLPAHMKWVEEGGSCLD